MARCGFCRCGKKARSSLDNAVGWCRVLVRRNKSSLVQSCGHATTNSRWCAPQLPPRGVGPSPQSFLAHSVFQSCGPFSCAGRCWSNEGTQDSREEAVAVAVVAVVRRPQSCARRSSVKSESCDGPPLWRSTNPRTCYRRSFSVSVLCLRSKRKLSVLVSHRRLVRSSSSSNACAKTSPCIGRGQSDCIAATTGWQIAKESDECEATNGQSGAQVNTGAGSRGSPYPQRQQRGVRSAPSAGGAACERRRAPDPRPRPVYAPPPVAVDGFVKPTLPTRLQGGHQRRRPGVGTSAKLGASTVFFRGRSRARGH